MCIDKVKKEKGDVGDLDFNFKHYTNGPKAALSMNKESFSPVLDWMKARLYTSF